MLSHIVLIMRGAPKFTSLLYILFQNSLFPCQLQKLCVQQLQVNFSSMNICNGFLNSHTVSALPCSEAKNSAGIFQEKIPNCAYFGHHFLVSFDTFSISVNNNHSLITFTITLNFTNLSPSPYSAVTGFLQHKLQTTHLFNETLPLLILTAKMTLLVNPSRHFAKFLVKT